MTLNGGAIFLRNGLDFIKHGEMILHPAPCKGAPTTKQNYIEVYRRNMVGSLPRGMPKVIDYRQTDAQATNKMVMQDKHEVLSRFGRRDGVIPMTCV